MAGCFDGKHSIERCILERQFHEIALHTAVQCRQALRLGQLIATLNLILVEGDTGHLGPSVCSDVATRTTNATSTVEHLLATRDPQFASQVIFMAPDTLDEAFARAQSGKVEALAPTPLVEQRGQFVVRIDKGLILGLPLLNPGLVTLLYVIRVVVQGVVAIDPLVHVNLAFLLLASKGFEKRSLLGQRVPKHESNHLIDCQHDKGHHGNLHGHAGAPEAWDPTRR
mmetsp:Transcript_47091/g.78934  ORF Transcript_47091/g.78934 Transcript_47091/m.78934 type:complete len:226 (-) Transcript_47091:67-744(-)